MRHVNPAHNGTFRTNFKASRLPIHVDTMGSTLNLPYSSLDEHQPSASSTTATMSKSPSTSPSTSFTTLSLHKSDIIRFTQSPPEIYNTILPVLQGSWAPGIQSHGPYDMSYEYKMRGRPFGWPDNNREAVYCCRLIRDALAYLYDHSWEFVTSIAGSRKVGAKNTLIFRRRRVDAGPPPPLRWLSVAMMGRDRLRIIYDPEKSESADTSPDHDHLGAVVTSVKTSLEELNYFQKGSWSYNSFEFKLKGWPWVSEGRECVQVRLLLLRIVECLSSFGWQSLCTVHQRTATKDDPILDTWYFVRSTMQDNVVLDKTALVS
ncbi:hypothetical protein B0H63DRAFT_487591 [Podospora didyma]|uniref:Uncharacterized protein n=1 Tax=Podospora didyma TaxID=330526 RepID=A0AAE0N2R2_9PEZI|nr:hypothetical protein B0H63DRAFT_487591 [Podospora didyma]